MSIHLTQSRATWMAIYRATRKNARRRNIPFDLSPDDFVALVLKTQGRCMLTGIVFNFSKAGGERRPWYPSIDRIDSRKGYTTTNCRIVCVAVNLAMNVWGEQVLNTIAEQIVKLGTFRQRNGHEYITIGSYLKTLGLTVDQKQRYQIDKRARQLSEARNLNQEWDKKGRVTYARPVIEDAVKDVFDTETIYKNAIPSDFLLYL